MILTHGHYTKRHNRRNNKKTNKKLIKGFDKAIMLVAVLVPLSNLPQLFQIWNGKDAAGVSLVSWLLFVVFTLFWLTYGLVHKEKPIITQSFLLVFIQIGIVVGTILYK